MKKPEKKTIITAATGIHRALGKNSNLYDVHLKLVALQGELRRGDAPTRYAIGLLVREVQDNKLYGDNPVGRLAKVHKLSPKTLYAWGLVAATWAPDEFDKLLHRTGKDDCSLSFSHLVLLASMTNRTERAYHVELSLEEALSEKELRKLVSPPAGDTDKPQSLAAKVRELTGLVEALTMNSEYWRVQILVGLTNAAPSELNEALLGEMTSGLKVLANGEIFCANFKDGFNRATEYITKHLTPPVPEAALVPQTFPTSGNLPGSAVVVNE